MKNITIDPQPTSTIGTKMNIPQQVKLEERVATLEKKVEQLMELLD